MLFVEELIENKIKALKYAVNSIYDILREVIEENKNLFEDLNTQQLDKGLNALDEKITAPPELGYKFYAPYTIIEKKLNNQEHRFITLEDEGKFHKSITVKIEDSGFSMDATDSKKTKLVIKYGEEILGITEENLSKIMNEQIVYYIISTINEKIQNYKNL